jgi:geranylgeranyl pyrophosphate synthase
MSPSYPPRGDVGTALLATARRLYADGMVAGTRETRLAGVLRDTQRTPGNLTRLRLGLIAGQALGLPEPVTRSFATALEYFHTASLLLDDLPCMDDAHLRRGRPCAHVVHGEGSTILGALAYINRAYRLLWDALAASPEASRDEAATHAERCLGALGVLDGQSLDLHFRSTDQSPRTVARIALGKTVSLLRLSLTTPAILAGAGRRERLLIDRVCVAWGLAYQVADDFSDLGSGHVTGKTAGRDLGQGRPNFVVAAGRDAAADRLHHLLQVLDTSCDALAALRPGWRTLEPLIDAFAASAAVHLHDLAVTRCA